MSMTFKDIPQTAYDEYAAKVRGEKVQSRAHTSYFGDFQSQSDLIHDWFAQYKQAVSARLISAGQTMVGIEMARISGQESEAIHKLFNRIQKFYNLDNKYDGNGNRINNR